MRSTRPLLLAILLAAIPLSACGWSGEGASEDRPLWTVARSELRVTVREGGSLEALRSETISSEVEGQSAIVEVVPEGTIITPDDVAAGRILVKLDAKELNEKLVRQQIDYKSAQAGTENARSALEIQRHQNASDIRQAELALRFAVLDLRRYVGDTLGERLLILHGHGVVSNGAGSNGAVSNGAGAPEEGGRPPAPLTATGDPPPDEALQTEIRAALGSPSLAGEALQRRRDLENEIQLSQEELKRAQEKLAWTERLLDRAFVSAEEREADRLAVERRKVELEKAGTAREQFVAYDFPKQVEKLLSDVVEARDDLERTAARARSAEARATAELGTKVEQERLQKDRLAAYEAQLGKSVIKATRPGLVVYASSASDRRWSNDNPIQQGTMVRENQAILTIPDAESLGAVVNIHESAIEKIEKGQRVTVVVDAVPDRPLEAVVEKKERLPNPNDRWMNPDLKVYKTQIRLLGTHATLQPGMSVRVEIEIATLKDVLTVPLQAIAGTAAQPAVWVLAGETAVERPVVLGLSNDAFVEIKEGVAVGDRVLLAPPRGLRSSSEKQGEGSGPNGSGPNGSGPNGSGADGTGAPGTGARPPAGGPAAPTAPGAEKAPGAHGGAPAGAPSGTPRNGRRNGGRPGGAPAGGNGAPPR